MQSKEELENWFIKPDPWNYYTTNDDAKRKAKILGILDTYERALDIGAGEGFVTEDLPAKVIHAIELSDNAAARLNDRIKRVHKPEGKYDLVITTGTLYGQYDHQQIAKWIRESATEHVLVAGIKSWLQPYEFGKILKQEEMPYREYTQLITLYEIPPTT